MIDFATRKRWSETWDFLGVAPPRPLLEEIVERHSEGHRSYHGQGHVLDCLAQASGCRSLQERPAGVDLALWYHDIVYRPTRSDNEKRSAEIAERALLNLVPASLLEDVRSHILDTQHRAEPSTPDGALVVDIDLSILGADDDRFDRYQEEIRREYRWVPAPLYRRKRAEVLRSFLDRPQIYGTNHFRERFEAQARRNLTRALS